MNTIPAFTLFKSDYNRKGGPKKTCPNWNLRATLDRKKIVRSTGETYKAAAMESAREILRREVRKRAGLPDRQVEHQKRGIEEHIREFGEFIGDSQPTEQHLKERIGHVRSYVEFARIKRLQDLDASSARRWLRVTVDGPQKLSARTWNKRRQSLRHFSKWLVEEGRVGTDVLLRLPRRNEKKDRRHWRRALRPNELKALLDAARRRPLEEAVARCLRTGVSPKREANAQALGEARVTAYLLGAWAGLRTGESARLRWCDLNLESDRGPTLVVTAKSAKSDEDQYVPLSAELAAHLTRVRPANAKTTDTVVPKGSFPTLRTFKRDLGAAGVIRVEMQVTKDERGRRQVTWICHNRNEENRVLDRYVLRMTFATMLVRAGTPLTTVQRLMRHAKVETTVRYYVDHFGSDIRNALESLPGAGDVLCPPLCPPRSTSRESVTTDDTVPSAGGNGHASPRNPKNSGQTPEDGEEGRGGSDREHNESPRLDRPVAATRMWLMVGELRRRACLSMPQTGMSRCTTSPLLDEYVSRSARMSRDSARHRGKRRPLIGRTYAEGNIGHRSAPDLPSGS